MRRKVLADKIFILLVVMFFLLFSAASTIAASPGSLWSDGPGIAEDKRAHKVGDILTVVISETTSTNRVGSAQNSKTIKGGVDAGTGLLADLFNTATVYGANDSSTQKGSIVNSNNITATLTVEVVGVQPNGNMLIRGERNLKQNNDEQKIVITGVVRPEDIGYDNTVKSIYIGNAEVKIIGKGSLSDKQKDGILTQIWNFIF